MFTYVTAMDFLGTCVQGIQISKPMLDADEITSILLSKYSELVLSQQIGENELFNIVRSYMN